VIEIKVKDIMRKDVFVLSKEATIKDALDLMLENKIGSVIVLEKEKPLGIVTERDILKKVLGEKISLEESVSKIMSSPIICISSKESVEKAAEIMTENKIKRLPVIENEKLVGIITLTDIVASGVKLEEEILKALSKWFPIRKPEKVGG
jgi:CBS domain-containing protein